MITGQALIHVLRDGDSGTSSDFLFRCTILKIINHNPRGDNYAGWVCAEESLYCMASGCHPYPNAVDRMQNGDRLIIKVSFQITYHQDHEGDWDEKLEFNKEKVLKRRIHKSNRNTMLWNTLIKQIERFTIINPDNAGTQTILAVAQASNKEVADYLIDFDIREVGNLRKIIPDAFPKKLRDGPLIGEKNIHGAWRVYPMALMPRSKVYDTGGYIL